VDAVNPEKRSSGSQFFIVTGRGVSPEELNERNEELNQTARTKFYEEFLLTGRGPDEFEAFLSEKNYVDKVYYTEKMKSEYTRKGGTPHLDFDYTIFGEVVLGMEVIKAIEQIPTQGERPLKAIRIRSMTVRE
jgi:cyclophilin family peptidyl-prolyl cis-trans isomerase